MASDEGAVLVGLWIQMCCGGNAKCLAGLGEKPKGLWRAVGGDVGGLELESSDACAEVGAGNEGAQKKMQPVILFPEELAAQVGVYFAREVAGGIVVEEDWLCNGLQTLRCTTEVGERDFIGSVFFGV